MYIYLFPDLKTCLKFLILLPFLSFKFQTYQEVKNILSSKMLVCIPFTPPSFLMFFFFLRIHNH